ncbi:helix-turn-helix domain-containing protein [Weissella confusa]
MLFALFTTFSEPVTTPETKTDHLKEVLSYINDHYAEQLPISELADMFSYNPNYLSRLFKQEIALSPVQYIYQVRLTHFYQDLLQTDEPVKELLMKNGLTNKRLAMQYFKAAYGTTPLQARKQHNEL